MTAPTVQLTMVDAGDLYLSWRWEHALDEPRALVLPRELIQGALAELAAATPSPLPGETAEQALTRALTQGPLVDRDREIALAELLSRTLLPHGLATELNAVITQGARPHLRIRPSPSTARVPWEALRVDVGQRTVHCADVSVLPPATVRNAPGRLVSAFDPQGTVVGVLDPRVPGFADASALGSVLGPVAPGSPLDALAAAHGLRRDDLDRATLQSALVDAARFLYVGHVTTGDHALDARLHLCCTADTPGQARPIGAHRPLTAADLALAPWRFPNRVALIACESGGDTRFAEPAGLVAALVRGGAEYVVSTRWTLPTDSGMAHLVPGHPGTPALPDVVVAVDAATATPDPVTALNAWQRDQATRWEATGDPVHSPVLWAAFSTSWAPAPRA
ncbi:CHAT domain-containing protein [Actinokineospora auranticolor]|uniref:CHAT domain-containing protein n=1 Tax=Actinokineospora auranticolor TaxID=155976 RepID=UPI001C669745|nr:CHAT domain-containing protein [Actinokineospora auranticolor]